MATVSKIQSGFMYKEDFVHNGSVVWQTFPQDTDRVTITQEGITIMPGEGRVSILTDLPSENFVLQVKLTHQPLSYENYAGVVVIRDNSSMLECQTYRDKESEKVELKNFRYIRLVRRYDNFIFYASSTGTQWELVGASRMNDANIFGFYFDCNIETENSLKIEEVLMYTSPILSFCGIEPSSQIIIKNTVGSTLFNVKSEDNNRIDVDLSRYTMPMRDILIEVFNPDGKNIFREKVDELYGGDVYQVKFSLEVRLNATTTTAGELLTPGKVFDLGILQGAHQMHTLTIKNTDKNYTPQNARIKVERYSPYNRGYEQVNLALEEKQGIPGTWKKELDIGRLEKDNPVRVFMDINKDTSQTIAFTSKKHKYRIIVE